MRRHGDRPARRVRAGRRTEELLRTPGNQEPTHSEDGQENVRYRSREKAAAVARLEELIERKIPSCRVRYAF